MGGKGGITIPGKGKLIERDYTPAERGAIENAGIAAGLVPARFSSPATGGDKPRPYNSSARSYDVYLNDVAYWRNIPTGVWEYTIGGYQVIKK